MSNRSTATIATKEKSSVMPMRSSLIQRQCACGNSAGMAGECSDCQKKSLVQRKLIDQDNTSEVPPIAHEFPIQTKLTVGKPGDIYEQEADRVAAQVMSMGNSTPSIQPATAIEKKEVQTKRSIDGESQAESSIESQLSSSKGDGSPLPDDVRSFMEPRFGNDFNDVRIHTNFQAVQMNRELNSQAFTYQKDIYFGAGNPPRNDVLTAHELAHTIQQNSSAHPKLSHRNESLQRKMNDGHDLSTYRLKGDPDLEDCYDDEARLTMNGMGKPGTRKVQNSPGIKIIKEVLIELGYLQGIADENYNQATWDAVKVLKKTKMLGSETMGDVGPGTMAWLNNYYQSDICPPCSSPSPRPSPCAPCSLPDQPKPSSSTPEYEAVFDGKSLAVNKSGKSDSCPSFSGNIGDPTPSGVFCIREQGKAQRAGGLTGLLFQNRERWYLIEPQFETTRSRMQIHPGTLSSGCVTVDTSCFSRIEAILNSGVTRSGTGYDGYPPGNSDGVNNPKKNVDCVGYLLVK